jgi:hypothetical protein
MSSEFSERQEAPPTRHPDKDPAIAGPGGAEKAGGFEMYPSPGDTGASREAGDAALRELGRAAITAAEGDGWGESTPETTAGARLDGSDPTSEAAGIAQAEGERLESLESDGSDTEVDDGWGRVPVDGVPSEEDQIRSDSESMTEMPLPSDLVEERTTANRIDLADNVGAIGLKESYDGYLDVVMHGDANGTQAYVEGKSVDFTLSQTAQMIESSPGWEQRPIRLMSCSTGRDGYAQELSESLGAPVYAPNGTLHVLPDGRTFIESPDGETEGAWRRFEPRATRLR